MSSVPKNKISKSRWMELEAKVAKLTEQLAALNALRGESTFTSENPEGANLLEQSTVIYAQLAIYTNILAESEVDDTLPSDQKTVQVYHTVTLEFLDENGAITETSSWLILHNGDTRSGQDHVSDSSPLGSAIMGKPVDNVTRLEVNTPDGTIWVRIINISM